MTALFALFESTNKPTTNGNLVKQNIPVNTPVETIHAFFPFFRRVIYNDTCEYLIQTMSTRQNTEFIAFFILVQADSAHIIRIALFKLLNRNLLQVFFG